MHVLGAEQRLHPQCVSGRQLVVGVQKNARPLQVGGFPGGQRVMETAMLLAAGRDIRPGQDAPPGNRIGCLRAIRCGQLPGPDGIAPGTHVVGVLPGSPGGGERRVGILRCAGLVACSAQRVETVGGRDVLLVAEVRAEQEAPAIGGAPQRDPAGFGVRAFARGLVRRRPHLQALVILAQDDVHHAADRVGAVNCRGAVGENLDPLHRRQRDDVQVHRLIGGNRRPRHAPPVQQHQSAIGADTVKIDRGLSNPRATRTLARGTKAVDRVVAEHVGHRFPPAQFDVLARDHHHRPRLLHVNPPNPRPGNHVPPKLHDVLLPVISIGLATACFPIECHDEIARRRHLVLFGHQSALVRKHVPFTVFPGQPFRIAESFRSQNSGRAIIEFAHHRFGLAHFDVHQFGEWRNLIRIGMVCPGAQPCVCPHKVPGYAFAQEVHCTQVQLGARNALLRRLAHPNRGLAFILFCAKKTKEEDESKVRLRPGMVLPGRPAHPLGAFRHAERRQIEAVKELMQGISPLGQRPQALPRQLVAVFRSVKQMDQSFHIPLLRCPEIPSGPLGAVLPGTLSGLVHAAQFNLGLRVSLRRQFTHPFQGGSVSQLRQFAKAGDGPFLVLLPQSAKPLGGPLEVLIRTLPVRMHVSEVVLGLGNALFSRSADFPGSRRMTQPRKFPKRLVGR